MAQLASDVNNPQFVGAMDPDSVMIARFYKKAVKNNFKSEQEGKPVWEDVLYCEYYPAGNTLLKMDVPAYEHHKQRFAKQWAYYQTTHNEDSMGSGTPLSQWAILSPADVENLKGMKVQTIENLAGMSDMQLQTLGMGIAGMAPHILRARAQAYLGSAADSALPQKQAQELETLKAQLAAQTEQMNKLMAMIEAKPKAETRGRREWTEEQKQAARERIKKAREARNPQAT